MRIFLRVFCLALLPLLLSTCNDDEATPDKFPQSATLDITEITPSGATFNASFSTAPGYTINDCGFIWADVNNVNIMGQQKIQLGPQTSVTTFSTRVTTDLEANKRYYVRSYLASTKEGTQHVVYGESVSFVSLGSAAPVVNSFTPKQSDVGDTLTIRGKNFSKTTTRNSVKIGTTPAWVINAADTVIQILVPDSLKTQSGEVSVSIAGNVARSTDSFTINPPIIDNFYPSEGTSGIWFTVYGKNFIRGATHLYLDTEDIGFSNVMSNLIYSSIPETAPGGTSPVKVKVFDQEAVAAKTFKNYSPKLTDFSPQEGTFGDVLTLTGSGFSPDTYNNLVYFEGTYNYATIVSATETALKIKVPDYLSVPESSITVYCYGYGTTSQKKFKIKPSQPQSFSPASGSPGDRVEIQGTLFSPSTVGNQVLFGDVSANVISATTTTIVAEVPAAPGTSQIRVVTAGNSTTLPGTFTVLPPVITDFSPKHGSTGTIITITGNHFGNNTAYGTVLIGPYACSMLSVNNTTMQVRIDALVSSYASEPVSLIVGDQTTTSAAKFTFSWISKPYLPGSRYDAISFAYNNQVYVGFGAQLYNGVLATDVVAFQPAGNTWNTKTNSTASGRTAASRFIIGDNLFVGLGTNYYTTFKDFWKCNLSDNTWAQVADFGGVGRTGAIGFSVNGKGYAGTGFSATTGNPLKDFWEYDPINNTWQALPDFPGVARGKAVVLQIDDQIVAGFGTNNASYFNDLWKFNTGDKTWTRLSDFPGTTRFGSGTFTIGNRAYLVAGNTYNGYTNEVWAYDFTTDSWEQKSNYPGQGSIGIIAAGAQGKGYIGMGYSYSYGYDLWEYDPTLDHD